MIRARFKANVEDYRPVKWPPPGPFWCTGYTMAMVEGDLTADNPIVVAYADSEEQIREFWPEATEIDAEERDGYTFTDRFPKPNWFKE